MLFIGSTQLPSQGVIAIYNESPTRVYLATRGWERVLTEFLNLIYPRRNPYSENLKLWWYLN